MQVVAVDVGNSSIKLMAATLQGDAADSLSLRWPRVRTLRLEELQRGEIAAFQGLEQPVHWFVSSVNQANQTGFRELAESAGIVESWHVIQRQEIPLAIEIEKPETVGLDRVLAALAAHHLFGKDRNKIVVDCGTAMTIDLVKPPGVFCGGVIMAGPSTNLLALNSMTAALPDLSNAELLKPDGVLGQTTTQAMLSGAWYGGLGAIKEVVGAMQGLVDGDAVVIGTGGGLGPWRDVLPTEWKLVEDLVLDGIFQVARQSIEQQRQEG